MQLESELSERDAVGLARLKAELEHDIDAMRAASTGIIGALTQLWHAMRHDQQRIASSLPAYARRELLDHMRTLNAAAAAAENPYFHSDSELERAEHYLLRAFPHADIQEIILAAARAGVAFSQLDQRINGKEGDVEQPDADLPPAIKALLPQRANDSNESESEG